MTLRTILAASTSLVALFVISTANVETVFAKDKGGTASHGSSGGSHGSSGSAPGHSDTDADGNRGHGDNRDTQTGQKTDDLDNPGRKAGEDSADGNSGLGDDKVNDEETAADQADSINIVSALNSPKKLDATLESIRALDLDLDDIELRTFDDEDLDIALKGGSKRSIENALRRLQGALTTEELAQFETLREQLEMQNFDVADVVGISIEGDNVIVYVRS